MDAGRTIAEHNAVQSNSTKMYAFELGNTDTKRVVL